MDDFSKYEILEAVVKSTKDKTISLNDVEKKLKRLGLKISDSTYSAPIREAVIQEFKLEKENERTDKKLIISLQKEIKNLNKQIQNKDQVLEKLDEIETDLKELKAKSTDLADDDSAEKSTQSSDKTFEVDNSPTNDITATDDADDDDSGVPDDFFFGNTKNSSSDFNF